jgi:formylglycine-generating enzyme required for sulfatase activity
MDVFEYPNQVGVLPAVMLRADEAKRICADEGKRLCRESEWTFACRASRALSACNFGHSAEVHVERLWDPRRVSVELAAVDARRPSVPTACVNAFGVHDLLGNVQEWTESDMYDYDAALKGGRYNQPSAECERSVHTTDAWARYPHTGVRCCRDPLVALPTDR